MPEDPKATSELVAGKYQLTRLLGRGGMGSVWEGVHEKLGTRVACKFIEAEYADSKEARERFENEARAAATLRSKHVVEVYDHGVMGDGRPYIVMEFLSGEPLDTRLDRQGVLSLGEMGTILQHVSRALTKAHSAGIIHRDLKPENVFLVWDEEDQADIAKVVDFGIAKFTEGSMGISSQTRTGSVLGTPYYMSPEQARGLRSLDTRSDLWSLGVITYQCLVGKLPFTGEAMGDLLVNICTSDPPAPSSLRSDLPCELDAWMTRALAREPDQRFGSAKEMVEAFSAFAGVPAAHSGQGAAYASMPASAPRPGRHVPADTALSETAAALTHGVERDARRTTSASGSRKFVLFGVVGTLLLVGAVVVAFAARGGSSAAAPPAPESPLDSPQAEVKATTPKSEPEASAEAPAPAAAPASPEPPAQTSAEKAPSTVASKPVASKPAVKARPGSGTPSPRPRSTTTPRKSDIDLGY